MGVIRLIKSDYQFYEHTSLECLVAIEGDDCKLIKDYFKKYKGKTEKPNDEVPGFKMIKDEEFESLKIDFEHPFKFKIKDLVKVK